MDDTTVAEPVAPSEPTTAVEDNSQPASPASEPTTSTEVEAPSEPTTPETPVETPEAPVESQPTRLIRELTNFKRRVNQCKNWLRI